MALTNIDPTNPHRALVRGITAPAQPQAAPATTGMAPTMTATTVNRPAPPPAPPPAPATGIAPPGYDLSLYEPVEEPELEDASVSKIVAEVMGVNSPLMKQARTAGLQSANSRGLLNSSIAVGAAEDSAYKVALPIAAQEAQQIHQRNQQRLDIAAQLNRMREQAGFEARGRYETYGYSFNLNQNQYDFQREQLANQQAFEKQMAAIKQGYQVDLTNLQATLQSKLQAQGHNEQLARMTAEFAQQTKMQEAQAKAALDQIKAQGDVQLTLQAKQFEQALKELTLQLNQKNSEAAAAAAVSLFNAEAQIRAALMNNQNMPAAERAKYEQMISQLTGPTRDYVNSVLGYGSTAPLPGGGTTTPPPTSGGGTGGGTTPPPTGGGTTAPPPTSGGSVSPSAPPTGSYVSGGIAPPSYATPGGSSLPPAGGVGFTSGSLSGAIGASPSTPAPSGGMTPPAPAPASAPASNPLPASWTPAQVAQYNDLTTVGGMTAEAAALYVDAMDGSPELLQGDFQ